MTAPQDLVAFCEEQHPRLVGLLGLYCGDSNMADLQLRRLSEPEVCRAIRVAARASQRDVAAELGVHLKVIDRHAGRLLSIGSRYATDAPSRQVIDVDGAGYLQHQNLTLEPLTSWFRVDVEDRSAG